jgi:hypothetical protein
LLLSYDLPEKGGIVEDKVVLRGKSSAKAITGKTPTLYVLKTFRSG